MKHPADQVTPELKLDGQPVFAFDIDRDDCEWPMPTSKCWTPKPRDLTLAEKWRMAAARKVEAMK